MDNKYDILFFYSGHEDPRYFGEPEEENFDNSLLEEEISSVSQKAEFFGKREHYVKKLKHLSQEAVAAFFNRHGIESIKAQRLLEKVKRLQKKTHRSHKYDNLP